MREIQESRRESFRTVRVMASGVRTSGSTFQLCHVTECDFGQVLIIPLFLQFPHLVKWENKKTYFFEVTLKINWLHLHKAVPRQCSYKMLHSYGMALNVLEIWLWTQERHSAEKLRKTVDDTVVLPYPRFDFWWFAAHGKPQSKNIKWKIPEINTS